MKRSQIRAKQTARGDRGLQMPNPRTAPLGVILVAGLPTAQALEAVGALDTPSVIEQAIRAEERCMARSAVLVALRLRLAARSRAEAQRRRAEGRTGIPAGPNRGRMKPA